MATSPFSAELKEIKSPELLTMNVSVIAKWGTTSFGILPSLFNWTTFPANNPTSKDAAEPVEELST